MLTHKVFLPLSTFNTAHVRKIPGSPSPPQLQCSCSGTGEPSNKANSFWLHSLSDQTGCVGRPGNEAVHLDLGMRLYILTWEWGCTSWPGNGAVHLDLGMRLYILTWEWGCTSCGWFWNKVRLWLQWNGFVTHFVCLLRGVSLLSDFSRCSLLVGQSHTCTQQQQAYGCV